MGFASSLRKMNVFLDFLFFFCFFFLTCSFSEAQKAPAMYVFGDSLVDVGNNNHIDSIIRADFPHNGIDYPGKKATGRFSNGNNSADFLGKFALSYNKCSIKYNVNNKNIIKYNIYQQ